MTDALVEINDRLASAARRREAGSITFYCECGDCLAEGVPLFIDEHDEIRAREDLIFAPGHDASRRYRPSQRFGPGSSRTSASEAPVVAQRRQVQLQSLIRAMPLS